MDEFAGSGEKFCRDFKVVHIHNPRRGCPGRNKAAVDQFSRDRRNEIQVLERQRDSEYIGDVRGIEIPIPSGSLKPAIPFER